MSLIGGKKVLLKDIGNPAEIALDWITQNVYYVDKGDVEVIRVCSLDAQLQAKVVDVSNAYSASRLTVDPFQGLV